MPPLSAPCDMPQTSHPRDSSARAFATPADNIVLIGFMGSGKSTLAQALALESSRFMLDSDALIQQRVGQSMKEYFASFGEEAFRAREAEFIAWVSSSVRGAIIATGGGMPIFHSVKEMGLVVYLRADFDAICARLDSEQIAARPLFGDMDNARRLFDSRRALYEKSAHLTIDATKPPHTLAQEILRYSHQSH